MPRIEQSVHISASPAVTYKIAKNVEAFPEFMEDLQSLTVTERSEDGLRTVSDWVGIIKAFKMKIRWTQEDLWDDVALRDSFKMLRGDMDRMEGYWQFNQLEDGTTEFESVLDYEINVPMVGPMVKGLVKKLMTDNLQSTLDAIKRKAESSI